MLTAVVGINWGDEGKGRMVDLFSERYDVIVRYQGGNNAGHTVINERGKFILNLLPSGILRPGTVNVMGTGMVIDLEHLAGEIEKLRDAGIEITPDNLKISDRATISMPYHKLLDQLEENRMGAKKAGSTQRGIAPCYSDKYMRKSIRIGDLLESDTLYEKLESIVDWKNLTVEGGYNEERLSADAMFAWLTEFGDPLKPHIVDTCNYLDGCIASGKNIMFEAQLGALRDIDYGIFPYTSSSTTLASYAPIGAGIPGQQLDNVIGIMKAYSSCVGGGPFTVEDLGESGDALRQAGGEYGAATGRPRRVGAFDMVASRYGVKLQGADSLALTKLDVMSYMKEIPVCVAYEVDGERTEVFPAGDRLSRAKPIYEVLPGFNCDISGARTIEELPMAARDYIEFIERGVGCPIKYVSVGAERDAYIEVK